MSRRSPHDRRVDALLCQSPGGSDYSLLVLLQVSSQDATAERAGQKLVPAARPAQPAGAPTVIFILDSRRSASLLALEFQSASKLAAYEYRNP
jgi:hypothetical protein